MKAYPRRAGPPTAEPITLAEALVQMKEISDSGGEIDTYATSLIRVAREFCEARTERTLIATSWKLTLDAFPDAIELLQPPIMSVESVRYLDGEGVEQTLDPSDYLLDATSEPGFLVPAPGKAWPATQDRINAVTVTYTAGYGTTADTVPAPLVHWVKAAVAELYEKRNLGSLADGFADGLLWPYRVVGI